MQRPRNRSEDLEDLLRRERMGMCRGKVRRLGRLARGMLTPTGQRSNCGSIPCSQNVARYYLCSASLGSFWLHCDTGGRRRWLICQRAVSVSRNYEPGGRGFKSCRARQFLQGVNRTQHDPLSSRGDFSDHACGRMSASDPKRSLARTRRARFS
jgi:hypothetical protein